MHWPDLKPNAGNPIHEHRTESQPGFARAFAQCGLHPARDPRSGRDPGLLIGLVAPAALRQLSGARNSVAKQSIERISSVLDLYKLDTGTYPTTDQGLAALVQKPSGIDNWNGPYLKGDALPADPWNHPYVYRNPSERTGHDFDLCSLGASGNASQGNAICNP